MGVQTHPVYTVEHADNRLTALVDIPINRVKTISNNSSLTAKGDWKHATENIVEDNTNAVKDNFEPAEILINYGKSCAVLTQFESRS